MVRLVLADAPVPEPGPEPVAVELASRQGPGHVVVSVAGRLEPVSAEYLADYLDALIDDGHRRVVIDVFAATAWAPQPFDPLEGARSRIRSLGGWLCVVGPDTVMRRGFRFRAMSDPLTRADDGAWQVPSEGERVAPDDDMASLSAVLLAIRDAATLASTQVLGTALSGAIGWALAATTAATSGACHAIDATRRPYGKEIR